MSEADHETSNPETSNPETSNPGINNPQIHKDSIKWLLTAGIGAVLLLLLLVRIDDTLAKGQWDKDNNKVLKEMRSAQSVISTGVRDERLLRTSKP